MSKTQTTPPSGSWEAQKAETARYIEEHRAWYEKTMTAEQLANLQQAVAPAGQNGGRR